jgi:hypothetical protein
MPSDAAARTGEHTIEVSAKRRLGRRAHEDESDRAVDFVRVIGGVANQ